MKKTLFLIACFSILLSSVRAQETWIKPQDKDTIIHVKQFRPAHLSLSFDFGWSASRHTYLAPLLYNGTSFGLHFERNREMRWKRWENFQLADVDFASGKAESGGNSRMWTGRALYRYAMHYNLLKEKLFVGPYIGAEFGFDYNLYLGGGNNPATVRVASNTGVSFVARHGFSMRGKLCQVDFLAQMPLLGTALMPEYGSSYYETFYLNTNQSKMHFTSLHNQQDLDFRLGVNIPVAVIPWFKKCKPVIRIGGFYHIDTMKINDIVSRYSSVGFSIGWTWKHLPL